MCVKESMTHFGFQSVSPSEKTQRVTQVFDSVASRYDLMNNILSFGTHHLWKRVAVAHLAVRPGQVVLDLAGGSGDLARLIVKQLGPSGRVILADYNAAMLHVGRDRLLDEGCLNTVTVLQANAEALPFEDNTLDRAIIGFGLRNFTHPMRALGSLYRACKPGGKIVILEFTQPTHPLVKALYDSYSFHILPQLGKFFAEDEDSYRYLAESIRMHPDPQTLAGMIEQAGFEDCSYYTLSAGIVACHLAYKY